MIRRRSIGPAFLLLVAITIPDPIAAEDRLVVAGDTLRGRVADLDADHVVFEPVYGSGAIRVPWSEVQAIETEGALTVLFGDTGELRGRILGLDAEGRPLVGEDASSAQAIEPGQIFGTLTDGGSALQRLRSRFRYWQASLDAGGSFTDATSDKIAGQIGTRVSYKKSAFHWLLEAAARFAQEQQTGDVSVTENLQYGFTRAEYDITERVFGFGVFRATRDTVQELALRLEPKLGAGIRVLDRDCIELSTDIGGAYVYEDFFGGKENSYWAVAFGADAKAELPYGATWRLRMEYVPAVDDWTGDYLIRGRTELEFPLLEWLSAVWSLEDEYDETPAAGTQRNRLSTALALRARFP